MSSFMVVIQRRFINMGVPVHTIADLDNYEQAHPGSLFDPGNLVRGKVAAYLMNGDRAWLPATQQVIAATGHHPWLQHL